MPRMRAAPRLALALACLPALAALAAGCGGGSDSGDSTAGADSAESRPAPPKSAFPSPQGRSLREVLKAADAPAELVVSPAAQAFYRGENRFPFGVFERDRTQVPGAEVALYIAKAPTAPKVSGPTKSGEKGPAAQATTQALDQPAIGPYPAAIESMVTQPAFRAKTTSDDPDAATVVYSSQIDFPSDGEWAIAALIKEDGEIKGTLLSGVVVGGIGGVPRPGEKAPAIHTPTVEDVGGDLAQIDTRIPPDTQHQVDYADALGKEPIVLLFATPQFCQSRVCGPVVDVAEQVKQEYGDEAAFIHMEIFNDNDPGKAPRPQVRAFNLPGEPYLFAIDRQGRVSSVLEGAFGLEALTAAVKKAVSE